MLLTDKGSYVLPNGILIIVEDEACRFNSTIAKKHLDELKELIIKIKNRLNILNDGSFELSDMITDQLRELKW